MARLKGYILTSERKDFEQKHLISFYGIGDDFPFKIEIDDFSPVFFIEKQTTIPFSKPSFQRKNLKLKTLQEKEVDALYFNTQNDLNLAKEQFSQNGIRTYESDLRSPEDI